MKKWLAIPLLLLVLSVALKEVMLYGLFKANQQSIADNWCINLDEPIVMCYGSCYFITTLEESHEEDSNSPYSAQEDRQMQPMQYLSTQLAQFSKIFVTIPAESLIFQENLFPQPHLRAVFHPPRFSA